MQYTTTNCRQQKQSRKNESQMIQTAHKYIGIGPSQPHHIAIAHHTHTRTTHKWLPRTVVVVSAVQVCRLVVCSSHCGIVLCTCLLRWCSILNCAFQNRTIALGICPLLHFCVLCVVLRLVCSYIDFDLLCMRNSAKLPSNTSNPSPSGCDKPRAGARD